MSKTKEILKKVLHFIGDTINIALLFFIIVGVFDFIKTSEYRSGLDDNLPVYLKDTLNCFKNKSADFNNDDKTDTEILGNQLFKACSKEIHAIKGLIYETQGILLGTYFNELDLFDKLKYNATTEIINSRRIHKEKTK